MKMPDITLAQLTAALTWVVAQAVASGLVDNSQAQLILQIGSTGLSAVWVIADAIIRNGRSRALINPQNPPTGGDEI